MLNKNNLFYIKKKYPKMRLNVKILNDVYNSIAQLQKVNNATYKTISESLNLKKSTVKTSITYLLDAKLILKQSEKIKPFFNIESWDSNKNEIRRDEMCFDWNKAKKILSDMINYSYKNGLIDAKALPTKSSSQMQKLFPLIQNEWKKGKALRIKTVRICTSPNKFKISL